MSTVQNNSLLNNTEDAATRMRLSRVVLAGGSPVNGILASITQFNLDGDRMYQFKHTGRDDSGVATTEPVKLVVGDATAEDPTSSYGVESNSEIIEAGEAYSPNRGVRTVKVASMGASGAVVLRAAVVQRMVGGHEG